MWFSSEELSHSWQPRFVLFLPSEDPGLSPLYSTKAHTLEGGEGTKDPKLQFWAGNPDLCLGSGWGSLRASSAELSSAAIGLEQASLLELSPLLPDLSHTHKITGAPEYYSLTFQKDSLPGTGILERSQQ